MKAHLTTMPYFTIWPEHHDVTHTYKRFLYFLTFVVANRVNAHISVDVSDYSGNLQQLSYLKHVVEQFENGVNAFSEDELNRVDIRDVAQCKAAIHLALQDVIKEIENADANLKKWQGLDEGKVDEFKNAVISQTRSNSLWWRAFMENDLGGGTKYEFMIGLNTFIEKSFLAENDNGIYVGFPLSFSKELIRQIDFHVERKLRVQHALHPFSGFKISKYDFKSNALNFDKDFSAVFINVIDYHEALYGDPGFQGIWKDNKAGITAKGCSVYYFGDLDISTKRLVAFDKHNFSKLEVTIPDDGFKVIDLNTSEDDRRKLYSSPSLCGLATDDKRDEELKKCVLVEIQGTVSFYMKDNAEIAYVEEK